MDKTLIRYLKFLTSLICFSWRNLQFRKGKFIEISRQLTNPLNDKDKGIKEHS
jgi:hypothetical protein